MPRKTKAMLAAGGVAVAALIAVLVALNPITVTYQLWRYRRDPDAVDMWMPPLCAGGRANLPYIYAAFEKYGKDADVAKFRAGIVAELRCIRRNQGKVSNQDNVYLDLPADPPLTSTIVRAYNQEPDAAIREDMLVYVGELDFRAWFEIYAGMASGLYELPHTWASVPTIDPYGHHRQGIAHPYEQIRAEWCRVVRPVVVQKLEGKTLLSRVDLMFELGRARCADSDIALLQKIAATYESNDVFGATSGLILATDSVERARQTLVPLFQGECGDQRMMFIHLEHDLDPAVASLIAKTTYPCFKTDYECHDLDEPACLAHVTELLARRPRPADTAP